MEFYNDAAAFARALDHAATSESPPADLPCAPRSLTNTFFASETASAASGTVCGGSRQAAQPHLLLRRASRGLTLAAAMRMRTWPAVLVVSMICAFMESLGPVIFRCHTTMTEYRRPPSARLASPPYMSECMRDPTQSYVMTDQTIPLNNAFRPCSRARPTLPGGLTQPIWKTVGNRVLNSPRALFRKAAKFWIWAAARWRRLSRNICTMRISARGYL